MSPQEETELVERCRAGEGDAWDEFFELHYRAMTRFVCQVVPEGTPEDIEEVCQESFLAAIRGLDGFGGRSRLQTWLFRIAANKARDFRDRRTAAKRGGGQMDVSLEGAVDQAGDRMDWSSRAPGPDEALASREAMIEVREALDALEEPCREILELRYFGELDYAAIGGHLNLNTKTVSSRLSRCLDRLGARLASGRAGEATGGTSV